MKEYHIAERTIAVPDEFLEYVAYKRKCLAYAFDGQLDMFWTVRSIETLDNIIMGFRPYNSDIKNTFFYNTIQRVIFYTVQKCIEKKIYDYDKSALYNKLLEAHIFDQIDEDCEELFNIYDKIEASIDENERAREMRKETRSRVSGGGFGLTGAIKGMLLAEGMNLATGLAHDFINFVGNASDEYKGEQLKKAIVDSGIPLLILQNALYNTVFRIMYYFSSELFHFPTFINPVNYDKSEGRLNNIEENLLPDNVARESILDLIQADPEYIKPYKLKRYFAKEEQKEIDRLADDMDVFHNQALYDGYASYFSFDTMPEEVMKNITIDRLRAVHDGDYNTCLSLGMLTIDKKKQMDIGSLMNNFGYYLLESIRKRDKTGKIAYKIMYWLKSVEQNSGSTSNIIIKDIKELKQEALDKGCIFAQAESVITLYNEGKEDKAKETVEKLAEKYLEDKETTLFIADFYLNGSHNIHHDYKKFEQILLNNESIPEVQSFINQIKAKNLWGDPDTQSKLAYELARLYLIGHQGDFRVKRNISTGLFYFKKAIHTGFTLTIEDLGLIENVIVDEPLTANEVESFIAILQSLNKKQDWRIDRLLAILYERKKSYAKAEEMIYSLLGTHYEDAIELLKKYCVGQDGKVSLHLTDQAKCLKIYQVLAACGNKDAQNFNQIYCIRMNLDWNKAEALPLLRQRATYDSRAQFVLRGEEILSWEGQYDDRLAKEMESYLGECPEIAYYLASYFWKHQNENPQFPEFALSYIGKLGQGLENNPSPYLPNSYFARCWYYVGKYTLDHNDSLDKLKEGLQDMQTAARGGIKEAQKFLNQYGKELDRRIAAAEARRKQDEQDSSLGPTLAAIVLLLIIFYFIIGG
ncbi:MAG: hypothetical protein LKE33_08310 [Acidaminococcus sp.]|jgi:hypothetical protein|nr:hypothetical protein [Acidaminococcus sp.]MCI2099745.1 hypothetical protein [Acidaminococcus sp.]MCI2113985.1 hypothetical protein [Acidaminococcus sp.]MCI2116094.1 hypothetical protein [Acidaminococcus sp.]